MEERGTQTIELVLWSKIFGDAIDPLTLPKNAVILWPHWNYVVKRSGVRRSRQCCNGSKFAAPLLHAMVSTWSSCVELPIQQLFIGLSAQKGLCMYGGDACDTHAHAPAPKRMTHLTIDDAYYEWYKKTTGKNLNCCFVLPVLHSLQRHPESGKMWMQLIDWILIKDLGFATTTKDLCIYIKKIKGCIILLLLQVDDFVAVVLMNRMQRISTIWLGLRSNSNQNVTKVTSRSSI